MPDVKHFLLIFERPARKLRLEAFDNADDALRERFRAERLHRDSPDVEIVVLTADSEDALHRTHARYFSSVSDLAFAGSRVEATTGQTARASR